MIQDLNSFGSVELSLKDTAQFFVQKIIDEAQTVPDTDFQTTFRESLSLNLNYQLFCSNCNASSTKAISRILFTREFACNSTLIFGAMKRGIVMCEKMLRSRLSLKISPTLRFRTWNLPRRFFYFSVDVALFRARGGRGDTECLHGVDCQLFAFLPCVAAFTVHVESGVESGWALASHVARITSA